MIPNQFGPLPGSHLIPEVYFESYLKLWKQPLAFVKLLSVTSKNKISRTTSLVKYFFSTPINISNISKKKEAAGAVLIKHGRHLRNVHCIGPFFVVYEKRKCSAIPILAATLMIHHEILFILNYKRDWGSVVLGTVRTHFKRESLPCRIYLPFLVRLWKVGGK